MRPVRRERGIWHNDRLFELTRIDAVNFLISEAHAQAGQPPSGGGFELIIMVVVFFAIFYFLIIRPQAKRAKEHRELVEGIARGDEVALGGGLMGKVEEIVDDIVRVEIAKGVVTNVQKQSIVAVLPKGTLKV